MALSESAALVVVEEGEAAQGRGARVAALVGGHGQAFDASRRRDETRSVRSIVRSMRLALEQARLGPQDVDVVCASANGLASLDRHEALAIAAVFDARAAWPRISALKLRIGEPLGAAGPLQCVAMIEAMRTGIVPALVEFSHFPDKAVSVFKHAALPPDGVRTCLINSLSHDGHSCSLVLTSSASQESLVANTQAPSGGQR